MTHPVRGSLPGLLTMSLVAAATTVAAMISWRGFVESSTPYLVPLALVGIVIATTGALARWWRAPGFVVVALQLAAAVVVLSLVLIASPLPIGSGWTALQDEFALAGEAARTYASPVPDDAPGSGVYPLLIGGGVVCLLLVDLFACTLRRVPLAGLPLLTVYSLPVSMLGGGLSWWVFAGSAAGFLALLYLHENEQITRWGRSLGTAGPFTEPGAPGLNVRTGAARGSAGLIGGVATALALIVPIAIPTMALGVFDFGAGNGDGDDSISVENPIVDLRRDLRRPDDVPLLTVETDDPNPAYLRISVLNRFRDAEWSSGDREVPTGNLPDGSMPSLEGVSDTIERRSYDYDVSVSEEFESTWLPTQAPVSSVQASGDWRFDPRTMDFIASDDDLDTAGLDYAMTAVDLRLRGDALARARPSTVGVSEEYTDLPEGLPDLVRDLALEQTADADNRYDKAVALQDWFRSEFTYSLDQAASANGVDALEEFLSPSGRVGYCEQFAASMAVMARTLGIPSRVAVGFLRPDEIAANTYEYSAYDLHAWPELFFDGFGWVRFEPTPPDRASGVPAYTRNRNADTPAPDAPSNAPETQAPAPDNAPDPGTAPEPEAVPEEPESADGSLPWIRILGGLGGLALLVLIVVAPGLVRERQRARRVDEGVEGAWAEIRATALDLRVPWPERRSPQETRDEVVRHFGSPGVDDVLAERPARGASLAPDAVEALDRLVRAVEVRRYGRLPAVGSGAFTAEVATCAEALRAGATPRVRRRARWFPPSVLEDAGRSGLSPRVDEDSEDATPQPVGSVEHLG